MLVNRIIVTFLWKHDKIAYTRTMLYFKWFIPKEWGSIMQKKKVLILGLAFSLALGNSFPAVAAARKNITSVSIDIDLEDSSGDEPGDEAIDVQANSDKYYVDGYEMIEAKSKTAVPEIEITLKAEKYYYFTLTKRSDVRIKGDTKPEYVAGKKRDAGKTLLIRAKLYCTQQGVGDLNVTWSKENPCVVKWDSSYDGEAYEVKLELNGKKCGVIQEVTGNERSLDVSNMIRLPGTYTAFVRECNPNSGRKSEWFEAGNQVISEEVAQKNKELYGYTSLDEYGWQQDDKGWWYKIPGGYVANDWLKNNDHLFYMDEKGYMITGWKQIKGQWYYFNDKGEMLLNTVTPDGYHVDENGVCVDA